MADFETMISIFNQAGIVYKIRSGDYEKIIEIIAGDGPKNYGYNGFITEFFFDNATNMLANIKIWE